MKATHTAQNKGARGANGSALIICLMLIVMVTILVVGLTTTARMELATTTSHVAGQESMLYARMGADTVRARLLEATTDPSIPWASGPGRILRYEEPADPNADPVEVPLFSGEATSVENNLSVDLNPVALTKPEGVILGDAGEVLAQKWIYVRKDGTLEPAATAAPTYSETNPIVGRFAFWTDDTSARGNLNTAWTRRSANTNPIAHPSRVDLEGDPTLLAAATDELQAFRANHAAFVSTEEVRSLGNNALSAAINGTPENFTAYSHAPTLTPHGYVRTLATTRTDRLGAGEVNYFDIRGSVPSPDTGPSRLTHLDNAKVVALFQRLYAQLSRRDLPAMPGRSFVDKYGALGTAQIIVNLIDYVRSAESTDILVYPLRAEFNATAGTIAVGEYASANTIMGNSRRPLVTELGVHVPQNPTTVGEETVYACQLYVEVHLPATAGGSINLASGYALYYTDLLSPSGASEANISAAEISNGTPTMAPGEYRTIIRTVNIPAGTPPTPPTQLNLRVALSHRPTPTSLVRIDIAPLNGPARLTYPVTVSAAGPPAQSFAIDDPHVKHRIADWTLGASTFGAAPAGRAIGTPATGSPIQDHDNSGNVTDLSVNFPAPGSGVNSLADLGRVHTGMIGNGTKGVPWRTLRFQPSGATPDQIPDWALLELFATPLGATPAGTLTYPHAITSNGYDARSGLINLNASIHPFSTATGSDPLARTLPLRMLLNNVGTLSGAALDTAVQNVIARTVASEGALYGKGDLYVSPGEIAEIAGIADTGEASEALLGAFIEQATARSNTFLIYSIGESVRQTSNGEIHPRGSRRFATLVEKSGNEVKIVSETELGL